MRTRKRFIRLQSLWSPFRRNINPADLSPEARLRVTSPGAKPNPTTPMSRLYKQGYCFAAIVAAVEWLHTLIRKGYHGGGIISVRSSDLPRVAWLSDMEPIRVPRHLRLGSLFLSLSPRESSTHGRPFAAPEYVVQRPVDDHPQATFFLHDDRSDNTADRDDRESYPRNNRCSEARLGKYPRSASFEKFHERRAPVCNENPWSATLEHRRADESLRRRRRGPWVDVHARRLIETPRIFKSRKFTNKFAEVNFSAVPRV